MLFLRPPSHANDIRDFCRVFNEGIRVEYKSSFDQSVRGKIAKTVSAFANSLGGVVIIGVDTDDGVPRHPVEGFDIPPEELPLVVEQICLQGINPPVIPQTTQIASDVAGKCFLIIEVEESPDGPHAIENQTKVYVRTGNASNPYKLAEVDVILERFTRRRELQERRADLAQLQRRRADGLLPTAGGEMFTDVSVGPLFPRRALTGREQVRNFASERGFGGGRFIPGSTIRRTNDGVAGTVDSRRGYIDLTQYGFVFFRRNADKEFKNPADPRSEFYRFVDVISPIVRSLVCASSFYSELHYRGAVQIDVTMTDCQGKSMPFFRDWPAEYDLDGFRCVERIVTAQVISDAERLDGRRVGLLNEILQQVCWSFWQPTEPFPRPRLEQRTASVMHEMGLS